MGKINPHKRLNQLAVEGLRQPFGVRHGQIAPHLVVDFAQRVGAGAPVRAAGQRLPQNQARGGFFTPLHHRYKRVIGRRRAVCRLMQLNHHAFGHNPRRIVADFCHRAQQRAFFFFCRPCGVFADADGQAVKL